MDVKALERVQKQLMRMVPGIRHCECKRSEEADVLVEKAESRPNGSI